MVPKQDQKQGHVQVGVHFIILPFDFTLEYMALMTSRCNPNVPVSESGPIFVLHNKTTPICGCHVALSDSQGLSPALAGP